jgi:hypothetical protein
VPLTRGSTNQGQRPSKDNHSTNIHTYLHAIAARVRGAPDQVAHAVCRGVAVLPVVRLHAVSCLWWSSIDWLLGQFID